MAKQAEPKETNLKIPKNYFKNNVKQLHWGGIPMYDIKNPILKILYVIYGTLMLGTFIYYYTFVEVMSALKNIDDTERVLFTLGYAVVHLMGCAKITVVIVKRKSILKYLQEIEKGAFLPNMDRGGLEEIRLIKGAVSLTRTQIMLWGLIVVIMLCNRLVWYLKHLTYEYPSPENANVTLTNKQFAYNTYYIFFNFDMQKSPYFELVCMHQLISIWIFAWYMGNADAITNGLMIHLTTQFKIVANSFITALDRAKRITKKYEETNQSNSPGTLKILCKNFVEIEEIQQYEEELAENFHKCVEDCIKHHQGILNLSEGVENTFNMVILAQFLSCLTLFCFLMCELFMVHFAVKNTMFIGSVLFLLGFIFQLFIFCWNGNELSEASDSIAEAAYNAQWIAAQRSTKMLIFLTILRSQRPVYITAGKFSKLSMETFATILRGSFSYFMVFAKRQWN